MSDADDDTATTPDRRAATRPRRARRPHRWLLRLIGALLGAALGWWVAGYLG